MTLRSFIKQNILFHYWNYKKKFKYFDTTVYFPSNSILFKRAIFDGFYEYDNIKIIKALLKNNSTFLDIGANIGLIATPILSINSSVNIISIEASPNTIPYLKKTCENSSHGQRWKIIDKAVSDLAGTVSFHLASSKNGAYDSLKDTKRTDYKEVVEVESTTIDDIWERAQKPSVSMIKIDVEGADLLALKGATNCIKECKPAILMEWNLTNVKPFGFSNQDLLSFANVSDYLIYALPGIIKIDSLVELDLFSSRTEDFLLLPANTQ